MPENKLLTEKKGPIYTLTLNRPEKRNALPFEMLRDICLEIEEQIIDTEIRGIIIKGNGKVFSAGVDLMTQLDMEVSYQSILLRSEDFQEGITALMEKRDPLWKRK